MKAVLKDPNGNIMANKLVTFNFEDGTGKTVRTDSKGVAQISTSGIDAGTYSITVKYTPESGSDEYDIYNSVSSRVTMTINKANAVLYAKSNGYWIINKQGQTVNTFGINNKQQKEIQIYLEDSNGNPLVGKTVYRSGYSSGSVTNSNGIATFTLSYSFSFPYLNPEPKSVTETFTFSDNNYNKVSINVPVRVGTG